ncbi:unnamed protein product [Arctogadus glacialis]
MKTMKRIQDASPSTSHEPTGLECAGSSVPWRVLGSLAGSWFLVFGGRVVQCWGQSKVVTRKEAVMMGTVLGYLGNRNEAAKEQVIAVGLAAGGTRRGL